MQPSQVPLVSWLEGTVLYAYCVQHGQTRVFRTLLACLLHACCAWGSMQLVCLHFGCWLHHSFGCGTTIPIPIPIPIAGHHAHILHMWLCHVLGMTHAQSHRVAFTCLPTCSYSCTCMHMSPSDLHAGWLPHNCHGTHSMAAHAHASMAQPLMFLVSVIHHAGPSSHLHAVKRSHMHPYVPCLHVTHCTAV